jgi:hypothetical protein
MLLESKQLAIPSPILEALHIPILVCNEDFSPSIRVLIQFFCSASSVFSILKPHVALTALYNSSAREAEHASTCLPDTREKVLENILEWAMGDDKHPICWLRGPAGSGKSTVAHTVAERCHQRDELAATFFFSRGKGDRSDIDKLLPTLAFQLAQRMPSIRPLLLEALADESTLFQTLGDRFLNLIVKPLRAIEESKHSMVIIIDGLDECAVQDAIVTLIKFLGETALSHRLPVRFLLTSRPETQIRDAFRLHVSQSTVFPLALEDFAAHNDIRIYLQSRLSDIRNRCDSLMRDVPIPWPSETHLETLVLQSEGLFIYVSTLLKFVDDGRGLPQEKLERVLKIHTGVDSLYTQVISEAKARDHPDFDQVMGSLMYLERPLSINQLAQLLRLRAARIQQAMQGCHSILAVPDNNDDSIRPYHASLHDFLRDSQRAQHHFLSPVEYHALISARCLDMIMMGFKNNTTKGGEPMSYACEAWHHHCCILLSNEDCTCDKFNFCLGCLQDAMEDIDLQWLKYWLYEGLISGKGLIIKKKSEHYDFVSLFLQKSNIFINAHLTQRLSGNAKRLQRKVQQLWQIVHVRSLLLL